MPERTARSRIIRYGSGLAATALAVLAIGATASGLPLPDGITSTTSSTVPLVDGGPLSPVLDPAIEPVAGTDEGAATTTTTSTTAPSPTATTTSTTSTTSPPKTSPTTTPSPAKAAPAPAPIPAGAGAGGAPGIASLPASGAAAAAGVELAAPGTAAVPVGGTPSASVMFSGAVALPQLAHGRSTVAILDSLAGLPLSPAVVARILAPFPVAGAATYTDDWEDVRLTPTFHLHQGTDIFAARGTPVIASDDGVVSRLSPDVGAGGISLRLTTSGGSFFYYAHLDRLAPTLREGKPVQRGDVVGFVGSTGNASPDAPHLHYQIHPGGGAPVNPVPYLDRWLSDAAITAASVAGAPDNVAGALAARRADRAMTGDGVSPPVASAGLGPAVFELDGITPISSYAAAPLGLFLLLAGAVVLRQRWLRRQRARRRALLATPPLNPPVPQRVGAARGGSAA